MRPNPLIAIFVIDFASPGRLQSNGGGLGGEGPPVASTEPFIPARAALPTVNASTPHADAASGRGRPLLHRSGRAFERATPDPPSHGPERRWWLTLPDR